VTRTAGPEAFADISERLSIASLTGESAFDILPIAFSGRLNGEIQENGHCESLLALPPEVAVPPHNLQGGGLQVNPDLRNLIALQDIDQKIVQVQKEISEIPARIQSHQDELRRLNDAHQRRIVHGQEVGKKRRNLEGAVDLMRAKLSRLKDQLMMVKTNKEYTAMLHEIQLAEEQIHKAEDEILDAMEEMDEMERALKEEEKGLKSRSAELQNQVREEEAAVPRLQTEVIELQNRKGALEKSVPEDLLARYRRIADQRKGIALAEAKDELCSLCHVRIRPQVYAELSQGEVILACDSCSRILFLRELT
jgi:predicted  nucleic acid-binding Zn-ribbon protein